MFLGGEHVCFTLENRADAIPAGTYKITIYDSPHLGRPVPLLMGVQERSKIEIHWGSEPANYKGCIGVGEERDLSTEEIFGTQREFAALFPVIQSAVETEGCQIEILDAQPPMRTSDLSVGDL